MSDAIDLARRLLGERQDEHQREIVVLTDVVQASVVQAFSLQLNAQPEIPDPPETNESRKTDSANLVASWKLAPRVTLHRFGTNAGNIGITRFQVRRSLVDPLGYEILAEVTNAADEPAECRLEIDLNDDVVDVVPLKLSPGERWSQTFEKTSADGGHLVAKLDRADVLAADNQAWAVLPKRELIPVTLVSDGNVFLQKVFESNPLVKLTRVEPAAWKDSAVDVPSITVLHRHVPEKLPSGSVLVIDPRGSCDLWQVGEPLQNPIVSQQDKEFSLSLLSHVRLDNVVMPEARQVKFASDEGVKVPARTVSGDPLLAII
ncbi:MAG TPA: hypothetical protein VK137_18760, partial [Planctomycetaceae bacterium]|nr:hypothetical protein [Planctomycetaceae bacterium]